MEMKKKYNLKDIWNSDDTELCDLLNKYSRTVSEKDRKIEELKELIAEVRTKASVGSDIFWLLDRVRL